MTNFEMFKKMSVERLSVSLCYHSSCDTCQMYEKCMYKGDEYINGYHVWLEEEVTENE